jgi:hypothetical protein
MHIWHDAERSQEGNLEGADDESVTVLSRLRIGRIPGHRVPVRHRRVLYRMPSHELPLTLVRPMAQRVPWWANWGVRP